jgi:hypothetical protein
MVFNIGITHIHSIYDNNSAYLYFIQCSHDQRIFSKGTETIKVTTEHDQNLQILGIELIASITLK